MKTIELTPTDSHKSFYGKCKVVKTTVSGESVYQLISYNTIVATYNKTTKEVNINGWYSVITQRHVNSFLSYFGLQEMNKNDYKKMNLL